MRHKSTEDFFPTFLTCTDKDFKNQKVETTQDSSPPQGGKKKIIDPSIHFMCDFTC